MASELVKADPKAPALVSREAPLSADDHRKLESAIEKSFAVEVKRRYVDVPVKDDLGTICRWESEIAEETKVLTPIGEPDPRLLEAVKRPAGPGHIAAHLTRLAAHLRHTKGDSAWQIVIEDCARDLNGVSEWAVVKACIDFRNGDSPFFPDTPSILAGVRKWDKIAQGLGSTAPKLAKAADARQEQWVKPTSDQRQRVMKIMHEAGFHRSDRSTNSEYCEACRREIEMEQQPEG